MKQCIIAALVMIGLTVAPVHQVGAAQQYVNDADINVIDAATAAIDDFDKEGSNENSTIDVIKQKAETASAKLDILSTHTFVTELGSGYTAAAEELKTKATALKTAMNEFVAAMEGDDTTLVEAKMDAYNTAETAFFTSHDSFNKSVDTQNAVAENEDKQTGGLYLLSAIATGLLAAASFGWAFMKKDSNPALQAAQRSIAISSLWPLAGALITYVTYAMAENGGSYTIMWGLIVFGLFLFVQSVVKYFQIKKVTKRV
jgi:hypothetical protein